MPMERSQASRCGKMKWNLLLYNFVLCRWLQQRVLSWLLRSNSQLQHAITWWWKWRGRHWGIRVLAYLNSRNNFYYFEPINKRAGAKERGLAILIYRTVGIFLKTKIPSTTQVDLPIIPKVNATAMLMHQRKSLTRGPVWFMRLLRRSFGTRSLRECENVLKWKMVMKTHLNISRLFLDSKTGNTLMNDWNDWMNDTFAKISMPSQMQI